MKNTDKRIIPAVTAFCLALCTMNAGVFNSAEDKVQAETEAIAAPSVTVSTSETASLPKNRKGTYRIEAREEFTATNGILTVSYYQNEVSLRDIRLCDSLKNAMTYTKVDIPGKIVIGFVSDKPISFKDNMIDIDFDFVSGQPTSVYCISRFEELETEDDNGTVQDISQNSLIYGSILSPAIGMTYSSENYGYASYSLSASRNCGFTNGVFTIEYDPETLEYTEVKGCGAFAESIVDAYVIKPGLIKCTVVSDKTISEDGQFLNLRFKILKDGTTDITRTIIELNDVVSENDIAEYLTDLPRTVTINVKVSGSPVPAVSKIPSMPYTQPYVTKATLAPPYTAPVVTTADDTVVSEVPSATTEVDPVISEPAETTEVVPVISEAPAVTTEAGPVISEPPVVTTEVAPVISEAPAETTVAGPVISEAPAETTVIGPVISEVPAETTEAAPVISEEPVVTTAVASVTTPEPVVTLPVEQGTVAGDINGDDSVTSSDLITLIKMILGTEKQSASSDLNGDGKTDSADLLELKKILAK